MNPLPSPRRPASTGGLGGARPGVAVAGATFYGVSSMEPKSGVYTTEFWLTLAGIAAGVALVVAGHPEIGGTILATAIPGYALSRGKAKGAP